MTEVQTELPFLLPTVEGCVPGIVAVRDTPDAAPTWGRKEVDVQCAHCARIETVRPYVFAGLIGFQFWKCHRQERLCPDCHAAVHQEGIECR